MRGIFMDEEIFLYENLSLRFKARLISVTKQPTRAASVAVVERCDDRATIVCRLGSGGWQDLRSYIGRVVGVSGSPIYSGEGRLLRVDECELYIG